MLLAIGTRGDIQPALALGKGLKARGHRVRVLAGANFVPWVERHGLEAAPTKVDMQAVMESEQGRDWVERGHSPRAQKVAMVRLIEELGWDLMMDARDACRDAHVIVSGYASSIEATSIAEKFGLAHVCALLQPAMIPTRSGWAVFHAPLPERTSALNFLFSKVFLERVGWGLRGALVARFRRDVLGMRPQSFNAWREAFGRALVLHGYSGHVVPHPPDWPANLHTTGYWFLDERGWEPPAPLLRFLDAGEPPVAIGFGSMTGRDARASTRLLVDAVVQSGRRAVLLSGWAGTGGAELPASVFAIDAAPHEWLFQRTAAVVHHGGAGTTAAGLRAGVPAVVVPHSGDQSLWGRRVHALGVGPRAIPKLKLSASALASAIRRATSDPEMRRRSAQIAAKIREEDGIGAAVARIEAYLRTGDPTR
ncbi:glycosyltransferase [Sorangium sp. So ce448]|uniref:glycosyltransferase n=1 Tax=Sorangium sp. So ce448 TaxID=3133314 RepID=UPI003F620211